MLFNSYEYIFIFLPITFFIYFYLNSKRLTEASKGFLVLASLFFYSWWNVNYLPIILSSMIVNYVIGRSFAKRAIPITTNNQEDSSLKPPTHHKVSNKTLLILGILFNLGLLGYFKYTDFFIENINYLTEGNIPTVDIVLPLAISFFTFQQIAYLVDIYKGETKEYDFLNYALFVTFFPQLIAGPIVHHKEMMPQFASKWNKVKRYRNIALGLFIFSIGLFKKVVIADTFAVWATTGFDKAEILSFFEAWATSLSYTFQLYFDFSGYTDMAIGAALLFNIKLPINFNSPYKALDIQDFWRRWHITLSRFLRDYVYIPLGGNKRGKYRTYTNLFATFIIGGIWHGAGWTFIIWGALHGVGIIIHRVWQPIKLKLRELILRSKERTFGVVGTIIAWVITFNFVNVAWVLFRAKELDDAWKVLGGMIGVEGISLPVSLYPHLSSLEKYGFVFNGLGQSIGNFHIPVIYIAFFMSIILFTKNSMEIKKTFICGNKKIVFSLFLLLYSILELKQNTEFLYFNF